MTLPGARGFAEVYVSKPLLLEFDGVHYDFSTPGFYFVDARHVVRLLLELDEVTHDGGSLESDNTKKTHYSSNSK